MNSSDVRTQPVQMYTIKALDPFVVKPTSLKVNVH